MLILGLATPGEVWGATQAQLKAYDVHAALPRRSHWMPDTITS